MNKKLFSYLAFFLCLTSTSYGEVQEIILKWTPALCQANCIQGIAVQFNKLNGVASIKLNEALGQMDIRWKPDVPFSYPAIYGAMSMVGLNIDDFRLRVQGTITHNGEIIYLTSMGDNTRFRLLGPLIVNPKIYVVEHNTATHPLSIDMRSQLLNIEDAHQVVTIEGPLLDPEMSPPLYLIVEKMKVKQPEEEGRI